MRTFISASTGFVILLAGACATPRVDRPSTPISLGAAAGAHFSPEDTALITPGFEDDSSSRIYVAQALNSAVDAHAEDPGVKSTVSLNATLTPKTPPPFGLVAYSAKISTKTPRGEVVAEQEAPLGSAPLQIAFLGGSAVGGLAVAVGGALASAGGAGLVPALALGGCGVCASGVGLGALALQNNAVEKDASDLLVRAMRQHADDLRAARSEIPPARSASTTRPAAAPGAVLAAVNDGGGDGNPWFAGIDGARVEIGNERAVTDAIAAGRVAPATLVWRAGMAQWAPAKDVPKIAALFEARADGWFVGIAGNRVGPLTRAALADEIKKGRVQRDTLVWRAGMANWARADSVRELDGVFP